LTASIASYESMESEVLEELSGLIRDAVCLKSYLAACTEFQREAFRSISASLLSTQPSAKAGQASAGHSGTAEEDNSFDGQGEEANDAPASTRDQQAAQAGGGDGKKVKKKGSKGSRSHALYGDDIKLPAPSR